MTICLKQILFHQEQLKSNLKELFSHFGKYVKQYTNIFAEVGGLLNNQKLYPFMYQGLISLSDGADLSPLDTIVKMGIYGIKPPSGSWYSLIVFSSFGGVGSDFQIILKGNNIQARIRITNGPTYKWTDWMKLNN